MKTFTNCIEIVKPRNDSCPLSRENCLECEHLVECSRFGGELHVICNAADGFED